MEQKKRFLKVYLILVISFGVLGLIDYLLTSFSVTTNMFFRLVAFLFLLFFLFNIVVIPILNYERQPKITFILPIYHLIKYILLFSVGIFITYLNITIGWLWIVLVTIGSLLSIFEIVFSIYLLKKLEIFY